MRMSLPGLAWLNVRGLAEWAELGRWRPVHREGWAGPSRRLYDALPGPKVLVPFTEAEGADMHCEPMARSLLEQRMFDWLDEALSTHG